MKLVSNLILISALGFATGSVATADDGKTAAEYNANDSGKNKRDTNASELTAQDQGSTKEEVEITRKIRRSITKDSKLSMSAHNIKIIVSAGSITLKGPVKTDHEKTDLEAKARHVAPKLSVINQLEVIQ